MTIKKNRRKRNATTSSSSVETAPSNLQEALWDFGAHLVQELGLDDRGDTLSHWIAHYLAELFMAEEVASGEAKLRLGERITKTVLMLWKSREHLPRQADPSEQYSQAVRALNAVHLGIKAKTKWDELLPGRALPPMLKFYELSSRLAIVGVLELVSDNFKDIPDWFAHLVDADEATFVSCIGDACARLSAEKPEDAPARTTYREKFRPRRVELLAALQKQLDVLRAELN